MLVVCFDLAEAFIFSTIVFIPYFDDLNPTPLPLVEDSLESVWAGVVGAVLLALSETTAMAALCFAKVVMVKSA